MGSHGNFLDCSKIYKQFHEVFRFKKPVAPGNRTQTLWVIWRTQWIQKMLYLSNPKIVRSTFIWGRFLYICTEITFGKKSKQIFDGSLSYQLCNFNGETTVATTVVLVSAVVKVKIVLEKVVQFYVELLPTSRSCSAWVHVSTKLRSAYMYQIDFLLHQSLSSVYVFEEACHVSLDFM